MNLVMSMRPWAYRECGFRGGTAGTCDTHVPAHPGRSIEDRSTGWGSMIERSYWAAQQ